MTEAYLQKLEVNNKTLASLLVDAEKAKYLNPFVARDCTISVAAKELQISKSRMNYWVKKYLEFGLLIVVRTEKQGRNLTKVYRTAADRIILPLDLIPRKTDELILEANMAPWWKRFKHALAKAGRKYASDWAIEIYRIENQVATYIVPPDGGLEKAKIANYWAEFSLSKKNAANLRREMVDMLERYQSLQEADEQGHIVHLAVVEDEE